MVKMIKIVNMEIIKNSYQIVNPFTDQKNKQKLPEIVTKIIHNNNDTNDNDNDTK